jgi:hypothetical protein
LQYSTASNMWPKENMKSMMLQLNQHASAGSGVPVAKVPPHQQTPPQQTETGAVPITASRPKDDAGSDNPAGSPSPSRQSSDGSNGSSGQCGRSTRGGSKHPNGTRSGVQPTDKKNRLVLPKISIAVEAEAANTTGWRLTERQQPSPAVHCRSLLILRKVFLLH